MESEATTTGTSHLSHETLNALIRNQNFIHEHSEIKEHLSSCSRCSEFVEFINDAVEIKEANAAEAEIAHYSRFEISDLAAKIYERSLPAQDAANFLKHLESCSRCFDYLGVMFEESLQLLPEDVTNELGAYEGISITEKVLELAPAIPSEGVELTKEAERPRFSIIEWMAVIGRALISRPGYGLAVAMLLLIVLVGQAPLRNLIASKHAEFGIALIVRTQSISKNELRPAASFQYSIFAGTHSLVQLDTAQHRFEAALRWKKDNSAARKGLAMYSYFTGNLIVADSLIQLVLQSDPKDFEAWNIKGLVDAKSVAKVDTAKNPDIASALEAFEKALHINPAYATAAYNRALVLEQSGRLDEAKEAWQAYLEEIDSESDWADIVREKLSEIRPH